MNNSSIGSPGGIDAPDYKGIQSLNYILLPVISNSGKNGKWVSFILSYLKIYL